MELGAIIFGFILGYVVCRKFDWKMTLIWTDIRVEIKKFLAKWKKL